MKKFTPYFLFAGLALVLMSNRFGRTTLTGLPSTGAPGESGQTCASVGCHFMGAFEPTITLDLMDSDGMSVSSYKAGETYSVRLTMNAAGPMGYGFQMVSLKDSDSTGVNNFSNLPTFAQEALFLERQYIEQNDIVMGNEVVLDWTAPEAQTGNVTFYSIVNAVDGGMSPAGDGVGQLAVTFTESGTSSTSDFDQLDINLFPNPAANFITIDNFDGIIQTTIFDMSGRSILSSYEKTINISNLNSGLHIARVEDADGRIVSKKFMKK